MYAVCYGNVQVFNHLVEQEAACILTQESVFRYNGKVFYVPRNSTALHLAVLVDNKDFISKLLDVDKQLFFQFNETRTTPF